MSDRGPLMLQGRGVTIRLIGTREELVMLEIERHDTTYSLRTNFKDCDCIMRFWGMDTDRFLLVAGMDTQRGIVLHCLDLQDRTCTLLNSFSTKCYFSYGSGFPVPLKSVTCSGSGRTVAMLVHGQEFSVKVLTFDLERRDIVSTQTFCRSLRDFSIPCFTNLGATDLVLISKCGEVMKLGQEQPDTFAVCAERFGTLSLGKPEEVVRAVCDVSGTGSFLVLLVSWDYPGTDPNWRIRQVWPGLVSSNGTCASEVIVSGDSRADVFDINHATGVGVMVCIGSYSWHIFDEVFSPVCTFVADVLTMELGVSRQAWMEACLRATRRVM